MTKKHLLPGFILIAFIGLVACSSPPTATLQPATAQVPSSSPTTAPSNTATIVDTNTPAPSNTPALTATTPPTNVPQPSPTPLPTIGAGSVMLASSDLRPMVFVPGGAFLMGASDSDSKADPDERPQHEVEIDALWVDQYEVTHAEYAVCVQAGACTPPTEVDNNGFPYQFASAIEDASVVNVTWNDANDYCTWAGKRLPTEAEWEKAARGRDARIYPWGNDADANKKAWFCNRCIFDANYPDVRDDFSRPFSVGSFPEGASPYGAHDMAGNAWEWVMDWYADDTYDQPDRVNPTGPEEGVYRVVRGGSWTTQPAYLRTTYRQGRGPFSTWIDVGFRCVIEDDRTQLVYEKPLAATPTPANTPTNVPSSTPTSIPSNTPSSASTNTPTSTPTSAALPAFAMSVLQTDDKIYNVAWSPDGSILASVSWENSIFLYEANSKEKLRTLHGEGVAVFGIAWSPDGSSLASGSVGDRVTIWDAASGEPLHILSGHSGSMVSTVAWSPDGSLLASGAEDATVILWDAATGEQARTLHGHVREVTAITFSPDGNILASGAADDTIIIWNAATGEQLHVLDKHASSIHGLAFSPDGSVLASGSRDDTIILWDTTTWQQLHTLEGHTLWVESVAFSPDGSLLASGSMDDTVILWDVATGAHLRTLVGHSKGVYGVAFSPDGSLLASGSGDSTIILWDVAQALP